MASPVFVPTSVVVNGGLWKLFPAINCDRVDDVPADYPGPIGVPISIMPKLNPTQFEIVGMIRPQIRGKAFFKRILIRHLHPDLPRFIDLAKWLEVTGAEYEVEVDICSFT